MLGFVIKQLAKGGLIILYRFQLDSCIIILPLVNQISSVDLIGQIALLSCYNAILDQVVHCQKQQRNRSQALLTVDDLEFHILAIRIVHRHNAAKEMAFTMGLDNLLEIIKKLFAVFCFPIVIALIYRDHKSFV